MGISNHEQFPVSLNSQEADETLIATNSNLSIGSLTRRQSEKLEAATSTKEVLDEKNVEVASPEVQSSTTYPEGGVRAWSTIFGAFLIQFTCFGYINSFGVYEDYYTRIYLTNYTPTDIGWIGGVQVFLTFFTGVVTGRFFDKGYFRHLVAATFLLNSLGLFMLSLTHQNSYYQVFLTHGIMVGLSTGITYVASLGIAGHYFRRRRPLAVGVISSGSALGAIVNPIMLNKFFNGPIGFHNGVRISAGINTALLLVALSIMRTRVPSKQSQKFPVLKWLREPPFATSLIGCIFLFFGLFYPVFTLQLTAVKHGVHPKLAFYTTSILNASSFFGRALGPGMIASRLGVFNLMTLMTICSGITIFCLAAVKDAVGVILFAVFFGFFSGTSISVAPSRLAHLCKGPEEFGTRLGIFFAIAAIVGLFASALSGALLTPSYLWIRPIIFNGVMMLMAGFCNGITRYLYGRGSGKLFL